VNHGLAPAKGSDSFHSRQYSLSIRKIPTSISGSVLRRFSGGRIPYWSFDVQL